MWRMIPIVTTDTFYNDTYVTASASPELTRREIQKGLDF